jgi:hypothetical protein
MTLANAHALFCGLKNDQSYLAQLNIGDDAKRDLMTARNLARSTLRAAALQISGNDNYWQDSYRTAAKRQSRMGIEVKFMTQGSFAYKTINDPAKQLQEIDLDDGMYVPVEFLDNGQPALTARGLFQFVETSLKPLVVQEGWLGVASKDNCVRVNLWDGAHLDIPIYSVPQDRYQQIVEFATASFGETPFSRTAMMKNYHLPTDKIMLARNDGTWIQSDPQKLHDWVDDRVVHYGASFRRLCRFFKGWRDHTWQKSDLSSLCLMRAVDEGLRGYTNDVGGLPSEERDDVLVLEVAKRLPAILNGNVQNPVLTTSCLNDWDNDVRIDIIARAEAHNAGMVAALEQTGDPEQVVLKLKRAFGDRIPHRPDVVKIAGAQIEAIKWAEPAKVAAPAVIASTSG